MTADTAPGWLIRRVLGWWFGPPPFRPGVYYSRDLRATEIILQDVPIVWVPITRPGHYVDAGYYDGKLVALRVWEDIRLRADVTPGLTLVASK